MNFDEDIKKAQTIDDVFNAVRKYYKTEEPLSFVKLTFLKAGLKTAIKQIKPTPR